MKDNEDNILSHDDVELAGYEEVSEASADYVAGEVKREIEKQ